MEVTYILGLINLQDYRNYVCKIKRNMLVVSDGGSRRGSVSAIHCYQKHFLGLKKIIVLCPWE